MLQMISYRRNAVFRDIPSTFKERESLSFSYFYFAKHPLKVLPPVRFSILISNALLSRQFRMLGRT